MENLTKKEISKELDKLNINHDIKQTKEELLDLFPKKYIVIHRFKDLHDNNKIYSQGDEFDFEGKSKERIKELSTKNNKIGKMLIKGQR